MVLLAVCSVLVSQQYETSRKRKRKSQPVHEATLESVEVTFIMSSKAMEKMEKQPVSAFMR